MSDSDSDSLLDPAILAAAAKRRKATAAPASKGGIDLEKLLKANKKRQANMAKSDAAAADLRAREERLAKEKAAHEAALTAPAAAAVTSEPEGGSPSADVDSDETAGLRATRLFTQVPRVPRVRVLELEEGGGPLLRRLAGRTSADPEVAALLLRGWVESTFARTSQPPAPPALLSWLLEVACFDPNPETSASAARALAALIRGTGVQHGAARGVPSPDAFAAALLLYGAEAEALAGETSSRVQAVAEQIGGPSDETPTDLRRNLLNVLGILPACAPHWRAGLPAEEVQQAVRWLWRLLLEPHAAPALIQLQDTISVLVASTGEAPRTAVPTASMLRSIGARLPHSSLLKLCQYLPPTPEGNAMQAEAAIAAIGILVGRRTGDEALGHGDGESSTRALSRLVVSVCDGMRPWSVYTAALHSVLLLLDAAVSCELPTGQLKAREDMRELRRLLGQLKARLQRYKAHMDYYALECESLLSYLQNKFMLVAETVADDDEICL